MQQPGLIGKQKGKQQVYSAKYPIYCTTFCFIRTPSCFDMGSLKKTQLFFQDKLNTLHLKIRKFSSQINTKSVKLASKNAKKLVLLLID